MSRRILVVPINHGAELTATCLGLVHALDARGVDVGYLKPVAQNRGGRPDHAHRLVRLISPLQAPEPIGVSEAEGFIARAEDDDLMERALTVGEEVLARHDLVVVEGLLPSAELTYSGRVNHDLAQALDAEILLVGAVRDHSPEQLATLVSGAAGSYAVGESSRVCGILLCRLPADADAEAYRRLVGRSGPPVVGVVTESPDLYWPRVADLVRQLDLEVLNAGDQERRIRRTTIIAQAIPGAVPELKEGRLCVFPGDRHDAVMASALATMSGTRLAAVLHTKGVPPDPSLMALAQPALDSGLPILLSREGTFDTVDKVIRMDTEIPADDETRTRLVTERFGEAFSEQWLASLPAESTRRRLSPAAFRRQLTLLAQQAGKRIVLPEGAEPRTVQAAFSCQRKKIAQCVLLAPRSEVEAVAMQLGLEVPDDIEIIDPAEVADRYVDALVERRRHKGMSPQMARDSLADTVVLGTMMLYLGEVDGLVSGAVHTTANTVRPALQVLGTSPDASLVSSVFFMGLPDEIVVYGDCAINPDPDAEQLADIAIQSADSAKAFGIEPRVAMISFSTGTSGAGADVQKVARATELVRQRRPDLLVDGPLQYDAATTASVARSKAPDSPVAGRATVFIFPDLNTGNTTYKAVQRSASVISVGPMLQGIAKPVNDLSRGALVEDIEYTIALTAIQAAAAGS
ncbi:phosphate acetyltransferase [Enemella evansiae]|uniref:phosphate acetyltransferase n=1 Tax=Enemella evansiae TaxID=2016499 RepID=UPI000B963226|nr:phosphate acetyltransferase [Enemella evansiae]OYO01998.1 phosphate acetyltransferase [Enemella evansiae]